MAQVKITYRIANRAIAENDAQGQLCEKIVTAASTAAAQTAFEAEFPDYVRGNIISGPFYTLLPD